LFKVQDNVTLKDLKDQTYEINQGLNLVDTRRVEDVQYERHVILQSNKTMLSNDDCVRNMFSVFRQHNMFPMIEIDVMMRDHLKTFSRV